MIEINLVPEQVKKKRRKAAAADGGTFALPKEAVIGFVGGFVVLLLTAHGVLQAIIMNQYVKHTQYKKEWEEIAPNKANADEVLKVLRSSQTKLKALEDLAGRNKISWSRTLNQVSDAVPRGVWLTRVTLENDHLFIKGSAVSKNQKEMIHVHNFTANLKDEREFMGIVKDVELGLIKSKKINTTEIAEFTITAQLDK